MFTGIVEEQAKVVSLTRSKDLYVLAIQATRIQKGLRLGDSVAIDGVCLTVTKMKAGRIFFDIMRPSILNTSLGTLQSGDRVNCERAMTAQSRFGGHFVTGHIDTTATIQKIAREGKFIEFQIAMPKSIKRYIVPKGSICVDGVSLTVGAIAAKTFSVFLIPFTMQTTTLGSKRPADVVNLEADLLAKYILNQ